MPSPPVEKRQSLRISVTVPHMFVMRAEDEKKHLVVLTDISTGGCQLGAMPGVNLKKLANARITLSEVPQAIHILEGRKGTVVWATDRYCGVCFNQQLDYSVAELVSMVNQNAEP